MVRRGLTGERLSALFLLGLVLLLPPLIGVFDSAVLVGGIPRLYLYLFAAWMGVIALAAAVVEWPGTEDDVMDDDEPGTIASGADGADGSGRPDWSGV